MIPLWTISFLMEMMLYYCFYLTPLTAQFWRAVLNYSHKTIIIIPKLPGSKWFRCYEPKIEESEKGRQPPGVEPRIPLAWAASALPLSHDSQTTTNPHNPLYVLHCAVLCRLPVAVGLFHFPLFSPQFILTLNWFGMVWYNTVNTNTGVNTSTAHNITWCTPKMYKSEVWKLNAISLSK